MSGIYNNPQREKNEIRENIEMNVFNEGINC